MTSYTAICRRSGAWWAISVPELRGVHTQARRLSDAEAMVREAIALFLDVAPDSFTVTLQPEVPEAQEAVADALSARQAAREADEKAATATRAALERLNALGLTVRDAGKLLGLSPQRVSQLTSAGTRAPADQNAAARKTGEALGAGVIRTTADAVPASMPGKTSGVRKRAAKAPASGRGDRERAAG